MPLEVFAATVAAAAVSMAVPTVMVHKLGTQPRDSNKQIKAFLDATNFIKILRIVLDMVGKQRKTQIV